MCIELGITAATPINPDEYGIHIAVPTAYLRTAYGQPAAIAFYNGTQWVGRRTTEFLLDQPGPYGTWRTPCTETYASNAEAAFAQLGFPHDLDLDRPQEC